MNVGAGLRKSGKKTTPSHERIEVENLPAGKELTKAINRRIPLFSYASEQRFRDLFTTLRNDAQIQPTYLVLMVLSTMLAAVGLYMSSSAVVIGAMLLALLMAPIVALAMGLLRKEAKLAVTSIQTIVVGIFIALSAAGLISLLFPHKPITTEMQARLNPSLLDLAVAIVAGIAGAYTKSHREILQSLAGVSIAVALVPPLAVAGIGLGMGDFHFFSQAFLLFSTNLIGITLAAAFTFRVLGYSSAVRNKPGIALVALVLLAITIPLYLSYRNIVATTVLENSWKHERFLINNKYLIVQRADLMQQKGQDLLIVRVLIREPLTRNDLNTLRKRIESDLGSEQKIRVQVLYIP
ncbi:MAG TPA: TIGR00341 family protein [Desulfobulbaceae bacterium]|nr:TIGR00341 family protein [Desulfobulbaceae bacterium]